MHRLPRLLACVALTTALVAARASIAAGTPDQLPNVLIVVTDDQRASNTLWAMPKTRAALAQRGARYPNAFSVTPLCCPSRTTIFTGRYAHNTGVTSQNPSALDTTTLVTRLLKENGYQTGLVGKFLNRWRFDTAPPYFDRWAQLCLCSTDPGTALFNVDGTAKLKEGHVTNLISNYAARFMRAFETEDTKPWFLYVAPTAPHWPWQPAPRYADVLFPKWHGNPAVLEKNRRDKPDYVRATHYGLRGARHVRTGQLRELLSVDDMVGRLSDLLDTFGEASNTLVFFTSDNGFTWADHGIGGDGGTAGQKRVPYTASVKIPLLVRWPGHVAAGTADDRPTGTVDIAPTVLAATGIAPDPGSPPLDGRSLLGSNERDRILLEYWRENKIPTWASLRTSTYQYIEYYGDDGVTRTFREYYDLVKDPWELRNLLHDGNPANNPVVRTISAQLMADRTCTGTAGPAGCP